MRKKFVWRQGGVEDSEAKMCTENYGWGARGRAASAMEVWVVVGLGRKGFLRGWQKKWIMEKGLIISSNCNQTALSRVSQNRAFRTFKKIGRPPFPPFRKLGHLRL